MSSAAKMQPETHPLLWRLDHGAPITELAAYESLQGYAALRKALSGMEPGAVTQLVKDANLRGRGGAGFPTGVKWSLIPMGPDVGPKIGRAHV